MGKGLQRAWGMGRRQLNRWASGGMMALCLMLLPVPVLAQTLRPEVRDPFLADPLQDRPRDPLLPNPTIPRPLSPLETTQLENDLNALNRRALTLLQADQTDEAFELWIREVRLRRLLGVTQELAAIQRVGQQAQSAGRTQDIQLLTARLRVIRAQILAAQPPDQALLGETATAFEILGEPNEAIALNQQLADLALASGDGLRYARYRVAVAQLQSRWFLFADAAATFRQLYELALLQNQPLLAIQALQRAIANYEQAQQFDQAIASQLDLVALYNTQAIQRPVPELQRAIARNYQALNNPDAASRYYQASYTNAITLEQFDVASKVIDELATLYRSLNRLNDVVYLYQQRLLVERKDYDAYGLMDSFDQLGQTYEQLGQPDQAVTAFREGLVLASHLQYRQDYFRAQLQRLSPSGATPVEGGEALPSTLPLEENQPSPTQPQPQETNPWRQ